MAIVADQMGGMPPGVSPAPQGPQTMGALPPQEQMPPGMEEDADEPEADVDHPAYQAALRFVADALYKNEAAVSISDQFKTGKENKTETMAHVAYDIMTVALEKLDGKLPEELWQLLTASVLEELAEIAEASGVEYSPADLADVFKQILLRFLGEMGENTTELESAMDQFSPELFNKLAAQAGDVPNDR